MSGVRLSGVRPSAVRLPEGYYLANFLTVLEEVEVRYGDLLTEDELALMLRFRKRSLEVQRLYVRLLSRKGPWFRRDTLAYAEIGDPDPILDELLGEEFCEAQPTLEDLLPLLTRSDLLELRSAFGLPAPKHQRRDALQESFLREADPAGLLPRLMERIRPVKLQWTELWRRVFLMFFGNFEQDLSSFVVADLGHAHYESYVVDPRTRVFEARRDVDFLLSIRTLREALETHPENQQDLSSFVVADLGHAHYESYDVDPRTRVFEARRDVDFLLSIRTLREALETHPENLAAVTEAALSMVAHPGVRQQRRFQGLLNDLGHAWEREQDLERAMACYALSERPPARERCIRIQATLGGIQAACRSAMALAESPKDVGEARFARIFLERYRKQDPEAD